MQNAKYLRHRADSRGEAAEDLTSIHPSATNDTEVGFVFNPLGQLRWLLICFAARSHFRTSLLCTNSFTFASRTTVAYSRLYSRPTSQIGEHWISREKRKHQRFLQWSRLPALSPVALRQFVSRFHGPAPRLIEQA
jgi:hypothetical protein